MIYISALWILQTSRLLVKHDFQQDGACLHYIILVRQYLDPNFLKRGMGKAASILLPARSPDLTPISYFLRNS